MDYKEFKEKFESIIKMPTYQEMHIEYTQLIFDNKEHFLQLLFDRYGRIETDGEGRLCQRLDKDDEEIYNTVRKIKTRQDAILYLKHEEYTIRDMCEWIVKGKVKIYADNDRTDEFRNF